MRFRPRQGLLAGIAILAAGSVVLEIALARTCAALLGRHFALAGPSLALAGVGLGGALLAALPGLVRRHALLSRLSYLAGLAAAATLGALLVLIHVKVPDVLDRAALGPAAIVYASELLPFVLVGVAMAGAMRHAAALAGRLTFATLGGAALGVPLAIAALRVGAPRAVLLVVITYAVASLVFYLAARRARAPVERPRGALVATFLLASCVLFAGDFGAPWLKLPSLRFAALDKVEAQEQSFLGLLTVDRVQAGVAWMRTDGTGAVAIHDAKAPVPVSPEEMAYVLPRDLQHDQGPVAIVGGAGGREVRIALRYGLKEIAAVDLDPVAVHSLMLGRYEKTGGDAYESPQVKVALQDGRSFVRGARQPFRTIAVPLPDTQVAGAAGALAAEPMDLFTVEAFADLLGQLPPDGVLMVTRWDAEVDRLIGLTAAALRRTGAPEPAAHLFACGASRATTLLAKKAPLSASDVVQLRNFCRKNKFTEAFAPDQPHGEVRRRLATELDVASAVAGQPTDLRPSTGDWPFFGYAVPERLLVETLRGKVLGASGQALVVLGGLLAVALVALFLAVALPLVAWPRPEGGRFVPLVFFTGVGASLAFGLTALTPRLTTLLGHPIYAFTTVVPALLVSAAVGGLGVERTRSREAEGRASMRAELLVVVLAATALVMGPLVDAGLGLPLAVRFGAAMALLVPVGALGGSLLVLGIKLVARPASQLVPWCWGMAGGGALTAAAVATPVAMIWGFTPLLLAAGLLALVAAACVPRRGRAA